MPKTGCGRLPVALALLAILNAPSAHVTRYPSVNGGLTQVANAFKQPGMVNELQKHSWRRIRWEGIKECNHAFM